MVALSVIAMAIVEYSLPLAIAPPPKVLAVPNRRGLATCLTVDYNIVYKKNFDPKNLQSRFKNYFYAE